MTEKEAASKGYRLVMASPFEVGLIYKERGVRTWWLGTFGMRMPVFDTPEVRAAIEINEQHIRECCPECGVLTGGGVCSKCLKLSVL